MKMWHVMKMGFVGALAAVITAGETQAQPVIDGSLDGGGSYGSALSVQNTDTQFGDAIFEDTVASGGGSEIDQVFATVANDRLYVLITGNLERNFNKLEIFIDSETGGHNTLDGATLPGGVDGFCCGGLDQPNGALERMNGLTFDAGIEVDHYLTFTNGTESGAGPSPLPFWALSAHYSDLTSDATTAEQNVSAGMQLAPQGLPNVLRDASGSQTFGDAPFLPVYDLDLTNLTLDNLGPALPGLVQGDLVDRDYALSSDGGATDDSGAGAITRELEFTLDIDPNDPMTNGNPNSYNHRRMSNVIDLQMAFDNSNVEGVVGGTGATTGNPQDVETGIEFSIPISQLNPSGDMKLVAFVNGTGHDFLSNQFAGDGILMGNLAGDIANINFANITGDQFVTIPFSSSVDGDFDNNGSWDCDDINALTAAIAASSTDLSFDMNSDGAVTLADVTEAGVGWLAVGGANNPDDTGGNPFLSGDANLDGSVDGPDFLIWNGTKFTPTDAWCAGDFNADGTSDGADFLIWNTFKFQNSDSITAVPEPATGLLLLLAAGLLGLRRR